MNLEWRKEGKKWSCKEKEEKFSKPIGKTKLQLSSGLPVSCCPHSALPPLPGWEAAPEITTTIRHLLAENIYAFSFRGWKVPVSHRRLSLRERVPISQDRISQRLCAQELLQGWDYFLIDYELILIPQSLICFCCCWFSSGFPLTSVD